MTIRYARFLPVLLAMFGAPAAMAATVTITASTLTPDVDDLFTMTITADVPNTFAATMGLSFDASKVEYVSGTALAPWNVFVKNSPVDANPTVFDVETPTATAANPGTYDVAVLTFRAIAAGAAGILIDDDGGSVSGWFDADTADYIPNDYTQAEVVVAGAGAPAITVTDSAGAPDDLAVPFGQVTENTTSAPQTITVTNTGDADLVIDLVAAIDDPFALTADSCSGMTLAPDDLCTLTVDFTPVSTGDFSTTVDIPSNLPTVTVSLSGAGTPMPVGNVEVTDSLAPATDDLIPFGDVTLNTLATATVTVSNTGNANLTIGQVASANGLLAPYSLGTDNCSNQILAPTDSCTIQVQFEPTALGSFPDSFDVPSDDPDSPAVTVSVTGTGSPVPVADISVTDSVSPAADLQVAYGDVNVGASVNQTITVTNAGTADLVLGTVAGLNALAAPFDVVTDDCSGQTVVPTDSCTIVVAFEPAAAQAYNDSFDIPSNDPDEASVVVNLSGDGVPAPAPAGGGGSSALDPATLLALGLFGFAGRRRATAGRPSATSA